jgi:hypothetical protein
MSAMSAPRAHAARRASIAAAGIASAIAVHLAAMGDITLLPVAPVLWAMVIALAAVIGTRRAPCWYPPAVSGLARAWWPGCAGTARGASRVPHSRTSHHRGVLRFRPDLVPAPVRAAGGFRNRKGPIN